MTRSLAVMPATGSGPLLRPWVQLLLSYRGRIGRQRFWLGVGIAVVLWAAAGVAIYSADRPGPEPLSRLLAAAVLLMMPLFVLCAVYAKRWHDRDRSGWWSLLLLAPVIGHIWILVELGLLPGMRGTNQYGPDPRD